GLLLRLKARVGDKEAEVVSECFTGLIELNPEEGVAFVAGFLHEAEPDAQESAIVALGESRRREAFEVLKAFWEKQVTARVQEIVLMALSLLRLSVATDFLVGLVSDPSQAVAEAAVAALAVQRHD